MKEPSPTGALVLYIPVSAWDYRRQNLTEAVSGWVPFYELAAAKKNGAAQRHGVVVLVSSIRANLSMCVCMIVTFFSHTKLL